MGLFGKKKDDKKGAAKPADATPAPAAPAAPTPLAPLAARDVPTGQVPRVPPPAPGKGKKSKKVVIDPVDFLNLRAELMDVKARLMAAEQSRAIVESRLAALDATAMALSNDQAGTVEAAERLAHLEARVVELGSQPASSPADAEALAGTQAALQAQIDELTQRVAAAQAAAQAAQSTPSLPQLAMPDTSLLAKIDALETQVMSAAAAAEAARAATVLRPNDSETATKLAALEIRIDRVEASAAEARDPFVPLVPSAAPTDPAVLARLDELGERVALIDVLTGQLSQLNARVIAQAEFGAQLSSLRDRISELQQGGGGAIDPALGSRVEQIESRLASSEGLATQLAMLAERVTATDTTAKQASEQVEVLEQRLNSVSTELANQISELGSDIDGLAARTAEVASGTVSDEVMAALRQGQIKLANEQARYEIAFREDLAALAEHVRRQPRG